MLDADIIYGRAALKNGEPWIVPESLDFVKDIVKKTWHVFEWGSGGSTVFWSRTCKDVITVESNENWVVRTTRMMESFDCPDNWTLRFIERDDDYGNRPFDKYADAILKHKDESFHLIFVDGEATSRERCIDNSIAKLRPGGYIVLDNSNWYKDKTGWESWVYTEKDLHWVGKTEPFDWQTTILRKPD
jgi:predicted O-methyltransferase YrrM